MGSKYIPVDHLKQAKYSKALDGPPKCSLTTPWLCSNLSFFRIDLTVIGPKPKKPKYYLSLSPRKAKRIVKAITNIIILLEKELR